MHVLEFLANKCGITVAELEACAAPPPVFASYPPADQVRYSLYRSDLAKMIGQPFSYHDPAADDALFQAVFDNIHARLFIIKPMNFANTLWKEAPLYFRERIDQVQCVNLI